MPEKGGFAEALGIDPKRTQKSGFAPTEEQQQALELFKTGQSFGIEAGAGCGKTATLLMLANSDQNRRGQYTAFNKAIVTEAQAKFPGHVQANTAHSLAFRAVGRQYSHRLNSNRMRSSELAARMGLHSISFNLGGTPKTLTPAYLASTVMRSIERFCQSADANPTKRHVPYIDGIDIPSEDGTPGWEHNEVVRAELMPVMRQVWADLQRKDGQYPFSHQVYLKIWQLSDPFILADYILFDESADANPVMLAAVQAQGHAQLVFVGDSAQCQPSGTMVTMVTNRYTRLAPTKLDLKPIEDVCVGDRVVSYNIAGSYLHRVGSVVKRIASRPYDGVVIRVQVGDCSTSYTPEHKCIVRIGEALQDKWVVYMMRRACSFRIGMVRGVYQSAGGDLGLPLRCRAEEADCGWILSVHDTEQDARISEAVTSWEYGIPTLQFKPPFANTGLRQEGFDLIWAKLGDLTRKADKCLEDHGRRLQHPICVGGNRLYRRRSQLMAACNLLEGMLMLPITGALDAEGYQVAKKFWEPISVRHEWYSGMVHSLEIEDDGTYVGDGVITHNSIYEFTGAVNAMENLPAEHKAFLSQSFRFGDAVAQVANRVLATLDTPLRLKGLTSIQSSVGPSATPDAVLTRTNAAAMQIILDLQKANRPAHLVGGGREVLSFARAANDLRMRGFTAHPDLACFNTWDEVQDYVSNDPCGGDLRLLTDLVDTFGVETIESALSRMPSEGLGVTTVSTAHKAKGREWDSVMLTGDFAPRVRKDTGEKMPISPSENRLLYVAVTRAKLNLDISAVPQLQTGGVV